MANIGPKSLETQLFAQCLPQVALSQARRKRDEAKGELDDGIDPAEVKRLKVEQ